MFAENNPIQSDVLNVERCHPDISQMKYTSGTIEILFLNPVSSNSFRLLSFAKNLSVQLLPPEFVREFKAFHCFNAAKQITQRGKYRGVVR